MPHFCRHRLAVLLAGVTLVTSPAAAEIKHMIVGIYGPRNVTRGSRAIIEISHGWFDVDYYTPRPETNRLEVPGHGLSNDVTRRVFTTGTHPHPLTSDRQVGVCDIAGDTFRLTYRPNPCTHPFRINLRDAGSGTQMIGRRVSGAHVVIDPAIRNLPPGVTSTIICAQNVNCFPGGTRYPGKIYDYNGNGERIVLDLNISPSAPLGSYNLVLQLEPGSERRDVEIPLRISALSRVTLRTPSSAPAIPSLSLWESTMTRLAAKWCLVADPFAARMSFGVDTQVWYYDGAQVYFDVAEYTRNPVWNNCGLNIASQYRDHVLSLDGRIQGYRVFTAGLAAAYRLTGDPSYLRAIELLAMNGLYANGGFVRDDNIRETAYALRAMVDYEKLTGIRSPHMDRAVALLLGMFDQLFVSNTYVYQQIFMDGIGMRALIEYWELTKDPRVPPAIKTGLDWIWANGRDPVSNWLYTNPDPAGPRCDWGCRGMSNGAAPDLINLVAPAYAWYWSITGNATYRSRADELFSRALDRDLSYSGKIFSQNYTWSFQHVRWRSLLAASSR